jgi:threonine/homoserine/homoserine lactone efflux protein
MLAELATGFGLGLSLAAPPGPVNALIAREAGRGGAWAGVKAGYPAPLLDTVYLTLFVFGLPRVLDLTPWTAPLALLGALLMAWFAWGAVGPREPKPVAPGAIWLVTLTNPFQYAWWLTASASLLAAALPWSIPGFLLAIFGWVFLFSHLVAHGAQRWPWFAPLVAVLSADALLAFALKLLVTAWAGL